MIKCDYCNKSNSDMMLYKTIFIEKYRYEYSDKTLSVNNCLKIYEDAKREWHKGIDKEAVEKLNLKDKDEHIICHKCLDKITYMFRDTDYCMLCGNKNVSRLFDFYVMYNKNDFISSYNYRIERVGMRLFDDLIKEQFHDSLRFIYNIKYKKMDRFTICEECLMKKKKDTIINLDVLK